MLACGERVAQADAVARLRHRAFRQAHLRRGVEALAAALPGTRITDLNLYWNDITSAGIQVLVQAAKDAGAGVKVRVERNQEHAAAL